MQQLVLKYLPFLIILAKILSCGTIGISPKLDFGEERLINPTFNNRKNVNGRIRTEPLPSGIQQQKVGIICKPSEGCNVTSPSTETPKDSFIQADVVVHVKTNVDLNDNDEINKSRNIEEETPDIPIIFGTTSQNANLNVVIDPIERLDKLYPVSSPPPNQYNQPVLGNPKLKIGALVRVPHFESVYHQHYFGENPPPQVAWLPKLETDSKKPAAAHTHSFEPGMTCSCTNKLSKGLQWYPRSRSFIDDKLAPLN